MLNLIGFKIFESIENVKISKILPSEKNDIIKLASKSYKEVKPEITISDLSNQVNISLSYKATIDGELVGFYLVSDYFNLQNAIDMDLNDPIIYEDINKYENKLFCNIPPHLFSKINYFPHLIQSILRISYISFIF